MRLRETITLLLAGSWAILAPASLLHAGEAESLAREGVKAYEKQDYEAALKAFRRAAELDPGSRDYQYNLGTVLAREEKLEEAEESFRKALDSPDAGALKPDAVYNLAHALASAAAADAQPDPKAKLKRLREAVEGFRQAVIADPKDRDAKYNLETARLMLRQLEEQIRQQQQQGEGGEKDPNEKEKDKQEQGESPGGKGDQGEEGDKQQQDQQQGDSGEQNDDADQGQQENKEQEDGANQQKGLEQEPTPQPTPGDQQGKSEKSPGEDRQDKGMEQQKGGQSGDPKPGEAAKEGEGDKPLTSEQLDALRVLNALAEQKPEQFKKLFQFKGQRQSREKDW